MSAGIIKDRFRNVQHVSLHMEKLANLPHISSDSNWTEIRKFYDEIESYLDSLNVKWNSYSALLVPMVMGKLPPQLKLVSRNLRLKLWSLAELLNLTLFPLRGVGEVKLPRPPHSNFLKFFRKYKLVWAVFLWLSIYIYLTYSEKSSGFCSSRKSGSGYFVGSTWKVYNFVHISYFLYSCRVAVFWWKDYIWWQGNINKS